MGRFATTAVPPWRIIFWSFLPFIALLVFGLVSDKPIDFRLLIPFALVGVLFSSFGFFLLWSARSGWAVRHLKTLLIIAMVGQALLLIWTILGFQK